MTRRHTMPHKEAPWNTRSKNAAAKTRVSVVAISTLAIAVAAAGVLYAKSKVHRYWEESWYSADAVIEDVRPKLVGQRESIYGGVMLYNSEVLARFSVKNSSQERWIFINQDPVSMTEFRFERQIWQGKRCVVRWNPANPEHRVIEFR